MKTIVMTPELYDYLTSMVREAPVLAHLREETSKHPHAIMQIPPEQGAFMAMLVGISGARKILEIGVFTGYSSLSMALALPSDGKITACDVSEEWTNIARKYWAEAGVSSKVELRLAPATDTLQSLLGEEGQAGTFDMAFIDADKTSYDTYYEATLKLLKGGGFMVLDNVLRAGKVIDTTLNDDALKAIQELNTKIAHDDRVDAVMLPIADGITMVRKRGT